MAYFQKSFGSVWLFMPLGRGAAEKDHIDAFDTKMSKAPARLFTQTKTIYKEPVVSYGSLLIDYNHFQTRRKKLH
jgi:hypothetical protein